MVSDFLWEKAPLVEVIAEIHWALKRLESSPDSRIDPYFDLFEPSFLDFSKGIGLTYEEELIPSQVPMEFVGDKPRRRLRPAEGRWPLAQVGPGVVTANIVPPYKGWAEFADFLGNVIEGLFESYPLPDRALRIERLHLRYIDGFDDSFGLQNYGDFLASHLGIQSPLPPDFSEGIVQEDTQVTFVADNQFVNSSPSGALGRIKVSPAKLNGRDAAILELHCDSRFEDKSATSREYIVDWFNKAHASLRQQFDRLATEELRTVMGKKVEIG